MSYKDRDRLLSDTIGNKIVGYPSQQVRNLYRILIDRGDVSDTTIYYTPYFNLVKKKIYFS